MIDETTSLKRSAVVLLCHGWLGLLLVFTVVCQATDRGSQWTVYLAQDKHLDYNWCG